MHFVSEEVIRSFLLILELEKLGYEVDNFAKKL